MLVRIAQLFEDGRPLPRHRAITAQPVHVGNLSLTEDYDQEFRRRMSYANLRQMLTGAEVLPRLHDAVVRWIGDKCMTISGFELDPHTRECSVQSWYVQLIDDQDDR